MAEKAVVKKERRVSSIWIIPGVALLVGAWMVFDAVFRADPVVEIRFETADGIEAGRTKVRARNIEVGFVESVDFGEGFDGVVARAQIKRSAMALLRDDAKFWVVRPRIGLGGISGVGTLFSGAYLELEPGVGAEGRRSFVGLESIPPTPATAAGVRLTVYSRESGSVKQGDPVLFRGRKVGVVDQSGFEIETDRFAYHVFVEQPYSKLVRSSTRFWKASAIEIKADADGVSLNADSMQSILVGGIAFDQPEGVVSGPVAEDGASFRLFQSKQEVTMYPYSYYVEYLMHFDSSVRGLKVGAPVEYRGVRVGDVVDVSFRYMEENASFGQEGIPVPALVRIYPGYLELGDSEESVSKLKGMVEEQVGFGLKGTLHRGNLLTGALFVSLDYFKEAGEGGESKGIALFPTQSSGVELIERKMVSVLEKIEALPIEVLVGEVREAIGQVGAFAGGAKGIVENLDTLLASEGMEALPERLAGTLAAVEAAASGLSPDSELYRDVAGIAVSLQATMNDLQRLVQKIERQPNSLIFSQPVGDDIEPKSGK